MVDKSYVRNISVKLVLEHLEKANVAFEPLLSQSGLQLSEVLKEDGWVPFYNHARFFEAAGKALNDPYFSLRLSHDIDPREFGALAYVGMTSKTLEDALLNLERYMQVVTGAWNMAVLVDNTSVVLEITPDYHKFFDYQSATEWFVANLIRGYQFSLKKELPPRQVRFASPLSDQKTAARYQELLGCDVLFGQDSCQVILDRSALQLPVKGSDGRLLKVLKSHCDQLLQEHRRAHSIFIAKIRENIIDLLPSGRAKAKLVAAEMGLTERTMLRRLADEDTNFSEIRETLRSDLAMKYIRDKRLSLKQVTYLLGYGDQSAFSVAFKRWNGCTPKEARIGI